MGALNLDEIATSETTLLLGESNPVHWHRRVGGTATNIAVAAARTHRLPKVQLLANCGHDTRADGLISALTKINVEVLATDASPYGPGRYSAVLQPDGEVLIGLADAAQAEALSLTLISELNVLETANTVVLDGNLSSAALREVSRHLAGHCSVIGVCVSPGKSSRFTSALPFLDAFFCNRQEAVAILETNIDPSDSVKQICAMGATHTILTDGENGIYVGSRTQCTHLPVPSIDSVHTLNGAGDALTGATAAQLCGHSITHDLLVAAITEYGIPAAKAVISGQVTALTIEP